ncbi:formate-dependent nitrite reductase complex subunit NrfG [Marinomonas aquimarina]|uniref:Formate-dependent nitrite reductase complex subunit NrfG n=1 Tax=Marinomonas aquimarina TaxID=295068 RepID=A0A1A8SZC4_9GAMM|nr:c-type cytochrome biogenesis protein CcmI [Marinomonas aquimarina]SBS24815.1 formate-dependent nitrite reductase complex subunit NrfG [Marinomonas aquimarina]
MMLAWIVMIAVTVICLLYLIRSVLRQRGYQQREDAGQNFLTIRQQEVEEERAAGRLTDSEAQQLHEDIVSEAHYINQHGALTLNKEIRWARIALAAAVALVLVGSVALYHRLGFAPDVMFTQQMMERSADEEDISEFLNYRVARYDRAEDWYYLASEQVLAGDYPSAIASYRQVLQKLDSDSADRVNVQVELAQAMFYANNNTVSQSMRETVADVLRAAPNNVKALGLQGIIDFDAADYQAAIVTWQKAIRLGRDRQERLDLLSGIAAARKQGGISEEQVPALITHRLQLQLVLEKGAMANDDVFLVYARAAGQPMPVAIQQVSAAEFAVPIVLTNIDNLMPGKTLSEVDEVEVIVKRSHNGAQDLTQGETVGYLSSVPSHSSKIFKVNVSL